VASMVSRVDPPAFGQVALDVMVEGPEARHLSDVDLRRLFPGSTLTGVRLNRLRNWPRFVVRLDDVLLGVATYTQLDGETHIPEVAVDVPARLKKLNPAIDRRVLYALLDAIELASVAGACRRIVVIPPREAAAVLERHGYTGYREGCAGAWMEKSLA
jgi:hypothetical protein